MIASILRLRDPLGVVRLVVLLGLTGCDVVFQLDTLEPVSLACGPFGPATPVAFSQVLIDGAAHDFSVDSTGAIGAVYAKISGVAKITMLTNTGGVWDLDTPARNTGLTDLQGHVNLNGELDVTIVTSSSGIYHYVFTGSQWGQDATIGSSVLDVDPSFDLTPGNEIDVFEPAVNQVVNKRAVITKHPHAGTDKNILMVVDRIAPFDAQHLWFEEKPRLQPLNNVASLSPSQGVLTYDLKKLVYAAKSTASATSDVFVSEQMDATFDAGQLLDSVSTPDHDEDEPWINADCSTIWFRRDGVTMMATKL